MSSGKATEPEIFRAVASLDDSKRERVHCHALMLLAGRLQDAAGNEMRAAERDLIAAKARAERAIERFKNSILTHEDAIALFARINDG